MANLTITVDDGTLKRARLRALQRDESVNAYLAESLRRYADADDADPMTRVLVAAERSTSGSGRGGRSWNRDELHRA